MTGPIPSREEYWSGTAAGTIFNKPACVSCRHKAQLSDTCTAFPQGIPKPIMLGTHQHREAFPGDHGIMWEPITGPLVELPVAE
jgi:hypothetical protein